MSEWRRNSDGGLTLVAEVTYAPTLRGFVGRRVRVFVPVADVFKAAKGNRWVVRIVRDVSRPMTKGYDQHTALTLRDAMRVAKFLVAVKQMEDDDA